ncbi:hypothetical protein BKA70DRAFT_1290821, partial [Coprinopsis sp. MPI-PUGE-AT-0042]
MLRSLAISGTTAFLWLLPRCGPSLKQIHGSSLRELSAATYSLDYMPPEREDRIHLEVLTMRHTGVNSNGLSDYLLDPRSLFSLHSLKRLEVHTRSSFNASLCSLFTACTSSLETLTVDLLT